MSDDERMPVPASTDSAGVPWAGRRFEHAESSGDDGSAPVALIDAITAFGRGEVTESAVVDAVRESRLLIPLVAEVGESGSGHHGLVVDKRAELAIVTVAGPDGRSVLPAFSSVHSMARWNSAARPVPATGVRVALAAAGDATELVIIDPTSATEFAIRRPALWAIAQSEPWVPSYLDPEVVRAFATSVEPERDVLAVRLASGDPRARLSAPELSVRLALAPDLGGDILSALLDRLRARWVDDETIATRVDSLAVTLVAAD